MKGGKKRKKGKKKKKREENENKIKKNDTEGRGNKNQEEEREKESRKIHGERKEPDSPAKPTRRHLLEGLSVLVPRDLRVRAADGVAIEGRRFVAWHEQVRRVFGYLG